MSMNIVSKMANMSLQQREPHFKYGIYARVYTNYEFQSTYTNGSYMLFDTVKEERKYIEMTCADISTETLQNFYNIRGTLITIMEIHSQLHMLCFNMDDIEEINDLYNEVNERISNQHKNIQLYKQFLAKMPIVNNIYIHVSIHHNMKFLIQMLSDGFHLLHLAVQSIYSKTINISKRLEICNNIYLNIVDINNKLIECISAAIECNSGFENTNVSFIGKIQRMQYGEPEYNTCEILNELDALQVISGNEIIKIIQSLIVHFDNSEEMTNIINTNRHYFTPVKYSRNRFNDRMSSIMEMHQEIFHRIKIIDTFYIKINHLPLDEIIDLMDSGIMIIHSKYVGEACKFTRNLHTAFMNYIKSYDDILVSTWKFRDILRNYEYI